MNQCNYDYDMIVIGSGPAGQRAAIQAAKLYKRVAVVEKKMVLGGVSVNTGTIPSKTLREAVLHLSGYRERGFYGASYSVKQNITMQDLLLRTNQVIRHEIDVTRHQLQRNRIEVLPASASFIDPHTVKLDFTEGHQLQRLGSSEYIVIAAGTKGARVGNISFVCQQNLVSDDIFCFCALPRTMNGNGAGG